MGTTAISRRRLLHLTGGGVGAVVGATLMAGCGLGQGETGSRFLPATRRPSRLLVVDTAGMSPEDITLLTSLQGLVNRSGRGQSLYLVGRAEDTRWLQTALAHIPQQEQLGATALGNLLHQFSNHFHGAVVYDPSQLSRENQLPYTKNVAATYAGLHDLLPVTAGQAASLHLKVRKDLTGRFPDEDAAYSWALQNLWPHCAHGFVVSKAPRIPGFIYDFAVATRAFCFTFNPFRPAQRAMSVQLYKSMHPNGLLLGWWSNSGSVKYEWASVGITSPHGVAVVAATLFSNATVWCGVPAPAAPKPRLDTKAEARRLLAAGKRSFMALQVTDGDNAAADQVTILDRWLEPSRGQVAISWSLDPVLADLAPAMIAHYRATATANDGFSTGPSGVGYMYADQYPASELPAYVARTARAMRATGITIPWVWPNPSGPKVLSDAVLQEYVRQIHPPGMVLGSGAGRGRRPMIQWVGNTPCIWASHPARITAPPPSAGYGFGVHLATLWKTSTAQIVRMGRQLQNNGTTVVLPEVLFELMRLTRQQTSG